MTNSFTRGLFGRMYADPEVAALFGAAEFTGRMLAFEAAWTRALHRAGAIGAADAAAALAVIAGFGRVDFGAGSEVDGLPVPALVTALRAGLEGSVAGAIHTGATSQDVIDSAMALTLLEVQDLLEARLSALVGAVSDLGERFGDRPLMARTRMQAALPATAGLRIGAWRRALEGQLARAGAARAEIARVQVGGPVGLRGDEAVAAAVARDLGLTLTPVWHADRSGPVSLGHWLTLVAGSLGKIGQDVALMAQQGVDEIALRGGGGSSAMPHKANPVAAEAMVTLARFVAAQQGALAQAMVHEQERSGAAWALEWMILPAMAEATGAALSHGLALMGQVERIGAA